MKNVLYYFHIPDSRMAVVSHLTIVKRLIPFYGLRSLKYLAIIKEIISIHRIQFEEHISMQSTIEIILTLDRFESDKLYCIYPARPTIPCFEYQNQKMCYVVIFMHFGPKNKVIHTYMESHRLFHFRTTLYSRIYRHKPMGFIKIRVLLLKYETGF